MSSTIRLPFYAKFSLILLGLATLIGFLYAGQGILIPLLLSLLFAILLRPVVVFLTKKLRFPHVISVLTAVLLFILLFASIGVFVFWQVSDLADDWNSIKENLNTHYHHLQLWVKQRFHISYLEQKKYIQQATKDVNAGGGIGSTLSSFSEVLLNFFLVPIYTFLFLLYRNLFLLFLAKLVGAAHQLKLQGILYEVKSAVQSFLVGLLIEMGIVSTLTTIGLMIVGVEYALLLGVITGLLNMIPYIGILIAGSLSIFATLTSSTEVSTIVGVIIVNVTVQLLDNNILIPMIVSSKVKINALVSIVGIIVGGAIAGVAGMFLAIPMIAILKVVFDRIKELEPWGFVMGDDLPKTVEWGKIRIPSFHAGNSSHEAEETKSKD
ncbi:MAG: AI-2E family transporter [Bacteroidetes bacterium]|nr:AI-2E family transporter [Bacteroidota bacterium]